MKTVESLAMFLRRRDCGPSTASAVSGPVLTRRAALALFVCAGASTVAGPAHASDLESLRFLRLRHGALVVEIGGRRVLVDPWLSRGPGAGVLFESASTAVEPEAVPQFELLLLTSSAPDRLDGRTLRRLSSKDAFVLVPDDRAARTCRDAGFRRVRILDGDAHQTIVGLDVTAVRARVAGVLPASYAYRVASGKRSVVVGGQLPPITADDSFGRFARDVRTEVLFADVVYDPRVDVGLVAPIDDLVLLSRLFRARFFVPTGDAMGPGVMTSWLVDDAAEPHGFTSERGTSFHDAEPGSWVRVAPVDETPPSRRSSSTTP